MTGLVSKVLARADREYARTLHLEVRHPRGTEGFALFGGHTLRHHFSRLYFGESREHRLRVGWHRGRLESRARALRARHGLAVFSGPSLPSSLTGDALRMPLMLQLHGLVPDDPDGFRWSHSAADDLRKIRKSGFTCTIAPGPDQLARFEHEFSGPALRARHETEVIIRTGARLRQEASRPGMEQVRLWLAGQWVGTMLAQPVDGTYYLHTIGWLHGDDQWLRRGVVTGLYWFSILRARELGLQRITFGAVAPYLEDGLLQFKGKWGGVIESGCQKFGDMHLLLDPTHATCRRFLERTSLVAWGADGRFVVFSARRPGSVRIPATIASGLARWYRWRQPDDPAGITDHADVPYSLRAHVIPEPIAS